MRIAILTWGYPPKQAGGTEIATQQLGRHLARRGHEVVVISCGDRGFPPRVVEDGVVVRRTPPLRPKAAKYFAFCIWTLYLVRRIVPDVIVAQSLWAGPPALACKVLWRRSYFIWGQGSDVYFTELLGGAFGKRLAHLVLARADAVAALTSDMKRAMCAICQREVLIIPNGVEPSEFAGLSRPACRRVLGIDAAAEVVLFLGSLIPIKGVAYLMRAMARVRSANPMAQLLLVGSGSMEVELRNLARSLDISCCVTFVGRVPHGDVPSYLTAADVLVLPSLSEGLPLVILEAMAAGLPIVTTDVRGLGEIVREGENGFVVPPEDAVALGEKISLILRNRELRERLGANNRQRAETFAWERIVETLEGLWFGRSGSGT